MFLKFAVAAVAGFVFSSTAAIAAPACLSESGDAAALDAARVQLERSCPCDDFAADGKESRRGDYLKCAKSAVASATDAGTLRRQCKKVAMYGALKSTCGYPDVPARKACLRPTSKGFACKISTCLKDDDVACPQHDCLAAADTSGDGQVTASDTGQCEPLRDCTAAKDYSRSRNDLYINECFGGCTNPLTFSECVLGCGVANGRLFEINDFAYATCQSDPARSCLQIYAATLEFCSETDPPAICRDTCLSEQICLASCNATANCPRYAVESYAFCLAEE